MIPFESQLDHLRQSPQRWALTGAGGFIGSHLLEALLGLDQEVVGLDDFSSGRRENLADVRRRVGEARWSRFTLLEGDVRDPEACRRVCAGASRVLHQAALVSVPRSIEDPLLTQQVNVDGFLNILLAAREAGARRVVYASSSAVYGDGPVQPKVEEDLGAPLSPYALSKLMDEQLAALCDRLYGQSALGLRYFNVFGPRQDPEGAYAAVIPKWIERLRQGEPCLIFGDGETSRDFCYVGDIVQANLRAALAPEGTPSRAFNVGRGESTTLNQLFQALREGVEARLPGRACAPARYEAARAGDIRHSRADLSRIQAALGYAAEGTVAKGLADTLDWYLAQEG
ncbi:MAG TPA: SDR family oxidoreductase [Holophagaceae bacterium]|nr:SDR family oxidoreductase [Holophagaceae bacterium]